MTMSKKNLKPDNEPERLKALRSYDILYTQPEVEFDRLTKLASIICGTPMSMLNLIDDDFLWFKSRLGIDGESSAREESMCRHTILDNVLLEVEDTLLDDRLKDLPSVTGEPLLRFYAGYPVIDPDGYAIGSLCVMDIESKKLNEEQKKALKILAEEAATQIVSRKERLVLENFEALFLESEDMICIAGKDGYLKRINPSLIKTLEFSEEELLQTPFMCFVHPDELETTKNEILEKGDGEKTLNFTGKFLTKSGESRYMEWVATPDSKKELLYAIGRDITVQRKIELELKHVREILLQTNRVARVGGWDIDLVTQKVRWTTMTKEIHEVDEDYEPTMKEGTSFVKEGVNRNRINELFAHSFKTGDGFDEEMQIITQKGRELWVRVIAKCELEHGAVTRIYGTFQDIDKEKQDRMVLDKVLGQLKAIMNAGTDISIISTDKHGHITTFNKGAEIMLGYKAEEVMGLSVFQYVHDQEEMAERRAELGKRLHAESPDGTVYSNTEEWIYVRKDGTKITVELSITALRGDDKRITGYLGIAKNITSKKIWERQLLLSEEKHRGFFENTQGFMCTHDLEGKFLTINPAGAELIGYSVDEVLQMTIFDVVPIQTRDNLKIYLAEIESNGYYKGLLNIVHKDGTLKTWMFNNVVSELLDGKKYVIGNATDMSSRIRMERELIKSKIVAEKNARAKDAFLANMSHEIRTPMNAIIGFTKLLMDTFLESEQNEYVKNINIASENLLGIINDILDVSKIESGNITLEEVPFDLHELVSNVKSVLNAKVNEKHLMLDMFFNESIPQRLLGDPTRLNQILLNLTNNAIKFTEKGFINIIVDQTEETDEEVTIQFNIVDTGIGISHDKLKVIFDRFSQANTDTTRKYGGTGLGLSISKSLIELQGGNISVESKLGEGSNFSFALSFKKAGAVQADDITKNSNLNSDKEIKVLLVEDNLLNQKLALRVLEKFGFLPDLAQNGRIAVEKVQQQNYDVVLMDLQMPEMDGYQATIYIRNELKNNIPIIAMTAHSLVGEKDKCMSIGMNDYIPKPFSPDELFNKITTFANLNKVKLESLNGSNPVKEIVVDLSRLRNLADGNIEFEMEMIDIFIDETPIDLKMLEEAINETDYATIRSISHKLNSSFSAIGVNDKEILKFMEEQALARTDIESIYGNFYILKNIFNQATIFLMKEQNRAKTMI